MFLLWNIVNLLYCLYIFSYKFLYLHYYYFRSVGVSKTWDYATLTLGIFKTPFTIFSPLIKNKEFQYAVIRTHAYKWRLIQVCIQTDIKLFLKLLISAFTNQIGNEQMFVMCSLVQIYLTQMIINCSWRCNRWSAYSVQY